MTQGLVLAAVGFVIVFTVLGLIASVVALIGRLDAGWSAQESVRDRAATDKAPTIDDTTLVLISAAVATLLQGRGRVRRIRRLQRGLSESAWSRQGLSIHHQSHRPRAGDAS